MSNRRISHSFCWPLVDFHTHHHHSGAMVRNNPGHLPEQKDKDKNGYRRDGSRMDLFDYYGSDAALWHQQLFIDEVGSKNKTLSSTAPPTKLNRKSPLVILPMFFN